MEETVLQIRGGDGLTAVVVVIAFVIFINCYNSSFGVETFQANPLTHQDPFSWLSSKLVITQYSFLTSHFCPPILTNIIYRYRILVNNNLYLNYYLKNF